MSAIIEKYKPAYGHETCATIVVGVFISLILYASLGSSEAARFQFKPNLFFNFFLPPIVFNAGFTMHKKMFFKNLGNVAMFGLVVTLVCFIIYSLLAIFLFKGIGVTMKNPLALNSGVPVLDPIT
jgi:NhaP-type Na+/H+ or K+/H+ antiporter